MVAGHPTDRPAMCSQTAVSRAPAPTRCAGRNRAAGAAIIGCWPGLPARAAPEAKVAELVDALALGASGATRKSSSLFFRTNLLED